jgi:hypothetical protein
MTENNSNTQPLSPPAEGEPKPPAPPNPPAVPSGQTALPTLPPQTKVRVIKREPVQ